MIDEISEKIARALERNSDYLVLRKLEPRASYEINDSGVEILTGVFLDLETKGLNSEEDKMTWSNKSGGS